MIQRPIAVGLKVCRMAIVEEGTKNVSLIDCYRTFKAASYPCTFPASTVCAVLTDGIGDTQLSIYINRLETDRTVLLRQWTADFKDPLKDYWFIVDIPAVKIPAPGRYELSLKTEEHFLAHCILTFSQEALP